MKKLFVFLMVTSTMCAMENYFAEVGDYGGPDGWFDMGDGDYVRELSDDEIDDNFPIMNIIVDSVFSFDSCNNDRLRQETEEIYGISITKNQLFIKIFFENIEKIDQTIQLPQVILYDAIQNYIHGQTFKIKLKSAQFDCKLDFVKKIGN